MSREISPENSFYSHTGAAENIKFFAAEKSKQETSHRCVCRQLCQKGRARPPWYSAHDWQRERRGWGGNCLVKIRIKLYLWLY